MQSFLKDLPFILIIIIVYAIFHLIGIGCPIKFISGISCAGCGMTRAWLSFFHLDINGAFYYHPLFWSVPLIIVLVLCKDKINKKVYDSLILMIIILYVTIYLIRLFTGSDIVTFSPSENIIVRLYRLIRRM